MSDVFISYASADRDTARAIAGELERRGLTVWWDRVIPPGRQYDEVIEENLNEARCVVVLWSATSAASKWVRIEAGEAMRQNRLVPALIESEARIPLEFSRVQAADLTSWRAGEASEAFDQLVDAIVNTPAPGPGPGPDPKPQPEPRPRPRPEPIRPPPVPDSTPSRWGRKQWGWVAAAVLAAGAVATYFQSAMKPAGPTVYSDPGSDVGSDVGAGVTPAESTGVTPGVTPGASPGVSPSVTPDVDPDAETGVSPEPGSVAKPNPQPVPTPPIVAGIDAAVDWEDHVLEYSGILFWDGSSGWGTLKLSALDMNSGMPVAGGEYQVTVMPISAQRIGFGMRLVVPGDSTTPGPHTHDIKLIFERQPDGGWSVIENCPEPNRCFPAEETMKVKA
jgi:hypothetical protein